MMDELDEMIRHRRIAASIATSILNDEAYVTNIGDNLLDAVSTLVSRQETTKLDSFSLDDKEIAQLMEKTSQVDVPEPEQVASRPE